MLTKKKIAILESLMREDSGYTTYPAELETRTMPKISRVGATLACKELAKLGILKIEKKRSPTRKESTPHFSLREDRKAFIELTKKYFLTLAKSKPYSWQSRATWSFMNSPYARRQINPNLVRDILSAKKVEMLLYMKVGTEIKDKKVVFERFRDHLPICFPIMPPNATVEEMSSKITIHNDNLTDYQKKIVPDIIKNHYREIEKNAIILPILALLQISPSALEFFLSGWKPYMSDDGPTFFGSSQGFGMIEHVLFRLVWNAINDLSMIRAVPDMGNVFRAEISGGIAPGKSSPLLRVMCHDHMVFEYEAGFDTDHLVYGDELIEVLTNPENCSVKIDWSKANGLENSP